MSEERSFGEVIRSTRIGKGMSIRQASRASGLIYGDGDDGGKYAISPSYWCRVEWGERTPGINALVAIAKGLGVVITIDPEGVVITDE